MAKLDSAVIAGGGVTIASAVVAGAAANTDITVAGYSRDHGATIIAAVNLTDGTDEQSVVVAGSADGKIKLTVDTTAKKLLLIWTQRAA